MNLLSISENKENMNFKHLCSTQFGLQYLGLHKPLFYNYDFIIVLKDKGKAVLKLTTEE